MIKINLNMFSCIILLFQLHTAKAMLPELEEKVSINSHTRKNIILLYEDEGASPRCLENLKYSLKAVVNDSYEIKCVTAESVKQGIDQNSTALFIMPGGRATPYRQKLYEKDEGIGNKMIKKFVEEGGNYLGLGAGAYYASGQVLFNQESLEETDRISVSGEKLLSFFPGTARGPMFQPFIYNSQEGCKAIKLVFESDIGENIAQEKLNAGYVYYNGGGFFEPVAFPGTRKIACYDTPAKHSAIIENLVGEGKVILSMVHPEYTLTVLNKICPNDLFVQKNLGPFLVDEHSLYVLKSLLKRLSINIKY